MSRIMNRLKQLEQAKRSRPFHDCQPDAPSPRTEVNSDAKDQSTDSPLWRIIAARRAILAMFFLLSVVGIIGITAILLRLRSTIAHHSSSAVSAVAINPQKAKDVTSGAYPGTKISAIAPQKPDEPAKTGFFGLKFFEPDFSDNSGSSTRRRPPAVSQLESSDTGQIVTAEQDRENKTLLRQLRGLSYNYLLDKQGALALIDGRPIFEGHKIGNLTVEKIAENNIVFRHRNKTYKVIWPAR